MQIDFHHAVTYVAARIAGFPHEDADIIACAAQYVDDATCAGIICFKNKAIYQRTSSAHKAIDPLNLNALENQKVWMPFHFLPGNGGAHPGDNPEGSFIHKLVCLPDSPVAKEMVRAAILDHDKPYSLHRLGITMHVYADTWAHQGFAGVLHEINDVKNFRETGNSGVFEGGLNKFINSILDDLIPPLGHGRANIFPDMPFLSWKYKNGHKEEVSRNNTELFCEAADALCKAMKRYLLKDPDAEVTGIEKEEMEKIKKLFSGSNSEEGEDRHRDWLSAIAQGIFSFGPAILSYAEDGRDSWKAQALGSSRDLFEYPYKDTFLTSNWKLFHDALQLHRITIAHDILPKYGICAA